MPSRAPSFARRVIDWQRRHGRNDLPWQGSRDPYRIWVAEIMLQQTQVAAVVGYYGRFLARFPDIETLADAPLDEVMRLWSGLGYYARARNLHGAAQAIARDHGGRFPLAVGEVEALPGIGRSTAGAIVAFATGEPHPILDGNVKRVFARHFGIDGAIDSADTLARLWELAERLLPRREVEAYTQGLMDLGATVCTRTRPSCATCPLRRSCVALREDRIGELPGRKVKRMSPNKAVAMLVIVRADEVLVEKRPASGIWGGLWSLPEDAPEADPARSAGERYGLRVESVEALEPFTHAFTHFTLTVTPWLLTARGSDSRAGEVGTVWLPLQDVSSAALPAPVKSLLLGLPTRREGRVRVTRGRGRGGGR